jgi:hypothetical protein
MLLLASSGCPGEDGEGGDDAHDSTHGHDGSGDHGTGVGTSDPTVTSGHDDASTGHGHDSTGAGGGSTGGAQDTGSTDSGGDTGNAALAEEWCGCMVVACHDGYHRAFGDVHPDSENNCLAAGGAVPVNGAPTQRGDFIECRIHFCEEASVDESACESALGGGACM